MSRREGRIRARFADLAAEGRAGLITFVTAGDPDLATSAAILEGLPAAGADLIELGIAFTDPMADGPAIQLASQRALAGGQNLRRTLSMVKGFRESDGDTPIVLMGYYNPIYIYGVDAFCADAADAGVDGLIVVDLPPEEDAELREPAAAAGIDFVRLTAPTSDEARLPALVEHANGFIYYVSITGVTGTASADSASIGAALSRIRRHSNLPIAVGFGIKTPEQAENVASMAEAAVVGSAIVQLIADAVAGGKEATPKLVENVLDFVSDLARGVRRASTGKVASSGGKAT